MIRCGEWDVVLFIRTLRHFDERTHRQTDRQKREQAVRLVSLDIVGFTIMENLNGFDYDSLTLFALHFVLI